MMVAVSNVVSAPWLNELDFTSRHFPFWFGRSILFDAQTNHPPWSDALYSVVKIPGLLFPRPFSKEILSMFALFGDEKVVDSQSPLREDGGITICSECSQIAFRVFMVRSSIGQREVGLCGRHHAEACAAYPEMRLSRI
jgi:hypothetical protein